jgi:DNA-directed RNA polymerase subunit beta
MQSLGLDIKILSEENEEIDIKESVDAGPSSIERIIEMESIRDGIGFGEENFEDLADEDEPEDDDELELVNGEEFNDDELDEEISAEVNLDFMETTLPEDAPELEKEE